MRCGGGREECHFGVNHAVVLSEELAEAPPATVARFAIPPDAAPLALEVPLPEPELPESLRRGPEVRFDAVVVPHEDGRWVLVPTLQHTIFVGRDEPLEETVARELGRHLRAVEPRAFDRLALLPPTDHRLLRVSIPLRGPGEGPDRGFRQLQRDLVRARARKHAAEVLDSVATRLHDEAALAGPPIVGAEETVARLDALLGGEPRHAVLLAGPERVGKTAALKAWLRGPGEGKRVYGTSGAQLVAGMSGLGQWQERVARVLAAAEELDAILYFDDLRDLFDRSRAGGGVDLAGAIKPALEEGRVRVVGELTEEAADLLGSQHEGFFQSFHTVRVPGADAQAGRAVVDARAAWLVEAGGPDVGEGARAAIVSLADRYLPYRPFPGKAAELFDRVAAGAERPGVALDAAHQVSGRDVYRLFSVQTGVPEFLLREDRSLDPERLRARFRARLVGQRAAVDAVVDTLCVVKAALQPGDKPLATFLFAGPTGVGKTELARALAEVLYGSEERLVRLDMSEFADPLAAERLVGAAGREGLLTRPLREQPFAVVLLDEIEKAHPAVFDLLLQVTGEGRLTDGRGRTAYFHNAILILTSNLGATHRLGRLGIRGEEATPARDLEQHYAGAVRQSFRPELVGRLDRIIPFAALGEDEIAAITRMVLDRVARRRGIADRGIGLQVDDGALDALARGGFDPAYGARALRRHVEEALVAPLAEVVTGLGAQAKGASVRVRHRDAPAEPNPLKRAARGELVVEARSWSSEGEAPSAGRAGLDAITGLRRDLDAWLQLPTIEAHREQVRALLAQLNAPRSKKERARSGAELARLQREHHAASALWEKLEAARGEVLDLEELVFAAYFEDERYPGAEEEARALRHRARMALLEVILAGDRRDAITVRCEELDEGRTLDVWLATLLADLERRSWSATLHLFKDGLRDDPSWPADRAWGPPRDPAWVAEWLARKERDRAIVLLRVRGPHAGTLLSVECGLHRYIGIPPRVAGAHHLVTRLAMRDTLGDADWAHPAMTPPRPPPADKLGKRRVVRWSDERPGQRLPPDYVHVPLEAYWSPPNADELALRDLIHIDLDPRLERADLYVAPLDTEPAEGEAS